MGFMDKVKSVAQDVGTQAKSATTQAQSKIEETQLKKKMDDVAKQLGHAIYAERTQGTPAETDRFIEEMRGLEAAIAAAAQPAAAETPAAAPAADTPVSHTDAAPPPAPVSTSASEPTSGDFKL